MKTNPKSCKGIGKCHGIDGCGKPSTNRKFGLCPSCLWEWMCTNENGKVWREKQFMPRVKKMTEKEQLKKKREERESLKSIARLINEARVPFQQWIRIRDANEVCISCGTTTAKIWHASHMFKAELYSGLIFDESNVHKSCEKCNVFLAGNESGYLVGLKKRYGTQYVHELIEKSNLKRNYKFTRQEISDIKSIYTKKIKDEKNKT